MSRSAPRSSARAAVAALSAAVDLHCHILPGLDDGARDLDDAIAMAVQAQRDGIGAICATPHIRGDHDVRVDELPRRLAELQAAIDGAGCATRVLPGAEVATTALDELDDDALRGLTLGGGGLWILLEPAPGPLDDRLGAAVARLNRGGYRAVIAHPERHAGPDVVDRLRDVIAAGALVQATAAFFVDPNVAEGMLALARAGVIHVLGSDAHSSQAGRPVALAAALGVLAGIEPTARSLGWIARTAPLAIVSGRGVRSPF